MRILLIIGWPLGQGGHINSTYSLIKDLQSHKEIKKICLIAPEGEKSKLFQQLDIHYIKIKNYNNPQFFNLILVKKIILLAIFKKIDIIHALDYKALKPAVIADLLLWKRLIFTRAGGKPLATPLPVLNNLIVFSKELKDHYNKSALLTKVHLIKERIDIKEFEILQKNCQKINSVFKIFVAMRLESGKKGLLKNLFRELLQLHSSKAIQLTIAGDGELFAICQKAAHKIKEKNSSLNIDFLGEVNNKKEILKQNSEADLVVGHGRGIMEAMAIGKPVLLLGFNQAGSTLVERDNIYALSDFNFSGRNIPPSELRWTLASILNESSSVLAQYGRFNKNFIEREYNSTIGAQKTLNVYKSTPAFTSKNFSGNLEWLRKKL